MRSIKFRAWDKKSKKMRIIDSIAFHGLGHFDIPTLDIKLINLWGYDIIEDKYFIIRRDPEQFKLLQYTGLKDKNGKEIYEGDVVKYLDGEFSFIAKVAWSDWMWYLEGINPKESFMFDDVADNETADIEIIGNRFEHPHLLEEST